VSQPLSEAFVDVAAYVVQFRQSAQGRSQTFEQVQARVVDLLSASRLAAADYSDADYDDARFAVCAWVDEAMTGVAWRGQTEWQAHPLAFMFYETRDAGRQFFERLDRLTPRQDPVREVYYQCLALGYKGRYTSARDQKALERRLRSNLKRLSGRRWGMPRPESCGLFRRSAGATGDRAKKGSALMGGLWIAAPPLVVVGLYILLSRMLAFVEQGRLTVPGWFVRPSWTGPVVLLVAALLLWAGHRLHDIIRGRLFLRQVMANREIPSKAPDAPGPWDPSRAGEIRPRLFRRSILSRPWYLLMGETGAGKTSAVLGAGLTSGGRPLAPRQGLPAPAGVVWWISDQAVILDPAGTSPAMREPGRDRSWLTALLALLKRYRQGRGLDGILVVVAANRLLQARPQALEADGRRTRERIDALLGTPNTVPVTILVTKCDLVHGMRQTAELLGDDLPARALGAVNPTPLSPGAQAVKTIMPILRRRLTCLRRIILAHVDRDRPDPGVLLFPQEFARLAPGLEVYSQALFPGPSGPGAPFLDGIFFASSRQEERRPMVPFLTALGLLDDRRTAAPADKGLFLRAIFARVLPDASARTTLGRGARVFQRAKRHPIGLAWSAMALGMCVALGIAAYENVCAMQDAVAAVPDPLVLKDDLNADLSSFQAYQRPLVVLERRNQAWWNTWFGLAGSRDLEERLKRDYCRRFDDAVLKPYDRVLEAEIADLGVADQRLGDVMTYLAGRINALDARAGGKDQAPQGFASRGVYQATALSLSDSRRLGALYADYLRWQKDRAALDRERHRLMSLLTQSLGKSGDWKWLTLWVNADPHLAQVALRDFWQGYPRVPDQPRVDPCFTAAGWRRIENFRFALRAALGNQDVERLPTADFQAWYLGAYAEAWHDLALAFSRGGTGMETSPMYRALAGMAGATDGPYFTFLERLARDLEPLRSRQPRPDWIGLVFEIRRVRDAARESRNPSTDAAVTAFRDYRTALARARASIVPSRARAFDAVSAAFGVQSSASPLVAAWNAYQRLNAASAFPDEQLWGLLHAPLDCLMDAACQEAGCHLQGIWEQTVLIPARASTDPERLRDLLFRPDGLATAFMQGPAAPFIERNAARGTVARTVLGHTLGFEPAFFAFLSQAEQKVSRPGIEPVYDMDLSVEGLPTEANDGARLQPHATRLDMYCGGEVKSLLNMNYPVSTQFTWTKECSAVALNIAVGDIVLKKIYRGTDALASFLRDFPRGTHTFGTADFPGQAADLKKLGITAITVQYRLIGHRPASRGVPQGTTPRIDIPARILRCPAPQE